MEERKEMERKGSSGGLKGDTEKARAKMDGERRRA